MDPAAILVAAVNGALAAIDQPPITTLDQNMHAARTAKALAPGVRDDVLAEHAWNFAEHRFRPAALSAAPDAEGFFLHPLPDDCIQVVEVDCGGTDSWKIVAPLDPAALDVAQARLLAARRIAPLVTATWRIVNAGLWSPKFRRVYELRLAARLAGPVGRNPGAAAELDARADDELKTGRRRDGQERARREMPRATSWLAARYRGLRP